MTERADSFSPRQRDLVAYYFERHRFASAKRRKKLAAKPLKAFRAAIDEWNDEAVEHQRRRDLHPEIAKDLYRRERRARKEAAAEAE